MVNIICFILSRLPGFLFPIYIINYTYIHNHIHLYTFFFWGGGGLPEENLGLALFFFFFFFFFFLRRVLPTLVVVWPSLLSPPQSLTDEGEYQEVIPAHVFCLRCCLCVVCSCMCVCLRICV